MNTQKGTVWEAIPTELDALWCPMLEFVSGCAESDVSLLMHGGAMPSQPTFSGMRYYTIRFSGVQMIAGYAESFYHILAEIQPGTSSRISEITNSKLIANSEFFVNWPRKHYMISSGGMVCEIIAAPDFQIDRFETYDAARDGARFQHATTNIDVAALHQGEDGRALRERGGRSDE